MKIVKIESFAMPLVALTRLTTDTGHQGWGQIATFEEAKASVSAPAIRDILYHRGKCQRA